MRDILVYAMAATVLTGLILLPQALGVPMVPSAVLTALVMLVLGETQKGR